MKISVNWLRRINMIMFNWLWYMLLLVAGGVLPVWLSWLVPLYAVFHLVATPYGWFERVLVCVCLAVGILAEVLGQLLPCVTYRDPGIIGKLPLWILMMWLNFAVSLAHSWWPWLRPWWAGVLVGALAAVFPYFGAQKAGILRVDNPEVLLGFWLIYGWFISFALNMMFNRLPQSNSSR